MFYICVSKFRLDVLLDFFKSLYDPIRPEQTIGFFIYIAVV
jgi:hypothetical protein